MNRRLNFIDKIRLLFLFLFNFNKYISEEKIYNETLHENIDNGQPSARRLKKAICESFWLILITGIFGIAFASLLKIIIPVPPKKLLYLLQSIAAVLLLWATLALRGWDIQSWVGKTYTEILNQFIFRSLYCIGTFLVVTTIILQ